MTPPISTLGEICDKTNGVIITGPFGSQLHESDYLEDGIPVIMPKDIIWGKISEENIARIGESDAVRLAKYRLKIGDIVFGRRGDIGRRAIISQKENGWLCGTGCILIRSGNSIIDPKFLYYYFGDETCIAWISNQAIGATLPNLNTSIMRRISLTYPLLPTQQKIAAILSTYDDLIENNTRRIKILEEMAQALYREWFVNFRFSGYEDVRRGESELGPVPEGWEIKKVKNLVKRLTAGQVYTQLEVTEEGQVPVIDQSRDEILGYHNNNADHEASPESPIIIFGDHTCKMQILIEPFSVGPNVIPFISANNLPLLYLYFLIHDLVETKEYKRHWTELTNKAIVIAPAKQAQLFSEIVELHFEHMRLLKLKNANLRCTRDLLLQKLISGELDVSGLDIQIPADAV